MFERPGDLLNDVERPFDRQPAFSHHKVLNIDPVNKLHRDVEESIEFAAVVNANDVLVTKLGGGLCFGLEPLDQDFVLGFLARQNLQRYGPLQVGIDRAVNSTHSAFADFLLNDITTERPQVRVSVPGRFFT